MIITNAKSQITKRAKIQELEIKLKEYEEKLAKEKIGWGGVKHESSASEIKHTKVMVLIAFVRDLKLEIAKLKSEL